MAMEMEPNEGKKRLAIVPPEVEKAILFNPFQIFEGKLTLT